MNDRFPQLFAGLAALAVAFVAGAAITGNAVRHVRATDDIVVTGSARRSIRSDLATWTGTVASQKPALADASTELRGYDQRVRAFLASEHIPDSLVSFEPVTSQAIPELVDGRETGRLLGYKVTESFTVSSRDVDRITALAHNASKLIDLGVPLEGDAPQYLYTKLADVRIAMLAEATRDARVRADTLARAAGAKIGAVRSVRMGVFQITPKYSTEVSDYGVNDTSSLDKDVTAVVKVTFGVE